MAQNNTETSNLEDVCLLLCMCNKDKYIRYSRYFQKLGLEPETKTLLKTIGEYFTSYTDVLDVSVSDLLAFFAVKHPVMKKRSSYTDLLNRLADAGVQPEVLQENLIHLIEKYFCGEAIMQLTEVLDGESYGVLENTRNLIDEYTDIVLELTKPADSVFVTASLKEILDSEVRTPGLKWRLSCLNEGIGELRGGSLGHVFARVDTGKTSFIVSEVCNFASQLKDDECILWCCNEEKGERIRKRMYQSILNCTTEQLLSYEKDAEEEFIHKGGGKIHLYDSAELSIDKIEELLRELPHVKLLVVDQGDKVMFGGDGKMESHTKLRILYGKYRAIGKIHGCDILTVGQANADAEGKQWLLLSHMADSKTGKPGELDYAIGIGKMFDPSSDIPDNIRYLHVCKNKMGTGIHGRYQAYFNSETATYTDRPGIPVGYTIKPDRATPKEMYKIEATV